MAITSGIFSAEPKFDKRLIKSPEELADFVSHLKAIGLKIVLTSGSFDLIHLGHVKYLACAKAFGDVLVVGVDSDEKIRRRKGNDRPLVPEGERLEMLAHQRPVDLLFLKQDDHAPRALITAVRPDVLVITADHSYDANELAELRQLCGEVKELDRQAAITTSERIRQLYMHLGERLGPQLADVLPGLIDGILKRE